MRLIKFSYRKIIDISCEKLWDQYVFNDTHMEFYMQSQYYDPKGQYATFQQLLDHIPSASQLHTQTSTAAAGYVDQLKGIMPDVANISGKLCMPFASYRFEIISSHVTDKRQHRVGIIFESHLVSWLDTVADTLLIAYGDQSQAYVSGQPMATDMLKLQTHLAITNCQMVHLDVMIPKVDSAPETY